MEPHEGPQRRPSATIGHAKVSRCMCVFPGRTDLNRAVADGFSPLTNLWSLHMMAK